MAGSDDDVTFLFYALQCNGAPSRARISEIFPEGLGEALNVAALRRVVHTVGKEALKFADVQLNEASRRTIRAIHVFHADYPSRLRAISDPPLVLFVRGAAPQEKTPTLAIVGSRKATGENCKLSERMAEEVTKRGVSVVSGLAYGIDSAGHRGALTAVRTQPQSCGGFAVLGSGVCAVYPEAHEQLAADIVACGGGVLSEFGVTSTPRKHFFVQRNRLISGLSDVVLVIDAREGSGALITARFALEQGKDVAAIPGNISQLGSWGPNRLIQQGAKLVVGAEDVLECFSSRYGLSNKRNAQSDQTGFRPSCRVIDKNDFSEKDGAVAQRILDILLNEQQQDFDSLIATLNAEPRELFSILSVLELKDLVACRDGQYQLTSFR